MKNEEKTLRCKKGESQNDLLQKNTDPEMPLPEDFDILFFGESGGRRKSKKSVKFIAVISAVCAAVAVAVLVIRHNAKKRKCEL